MSKKILVVGGGGREHAIIKALKKSPDCGEVWCAPGNGGIGYDAHCVNIKATDVETMVGFAETEKFDYVVVAQDDPLALGMVDALAAVGIPAFGPDKAAARIEASKVFSKDLIGDMLNCYQQSIEKSGTDEIQSLAFQNVLANSMRNKNGMREAEKILEMDFDSNVERQMVIKALIKAVEYTRMNDLRNAWHQLDIIDRERSLTIVLLRHLLNGYKDYKDGSVMDFYNFIVNDLHVKMHKIKKKTIKDFYMNHTYADAALGVKYGDSNDALRSNSNASL